MESLPFEKDMRQSLSTTESKPIFSELHYGKENRLEIKVDEEHQVRFDTLCKKRSPRMICGNDRCIKKNHIKSLKDKWYWFPNVTEN